MTPILLFLALAATAPATTPATPLPTHDQAGNRIETFAATPPSGPEGAPPLHCTADRAWCAEISRDVDQNTSELHVFAGTPSDHPPVVTLALTTEDEDEELALWPSIVRLAGPNAGVLVGVEHHVTTSYSGGGGGATTLHLIRVRGEEAKPVLTAPISGALMIRACFDERDMKARRGACHDEYNFDGELTLDPTTASGPPRLAYETQATVFPAGASRGGDSTLRGPLRQKDLVTTRDPACSYKRAFAMDPTSDVYAPDKALPDCSDYTAP